MLPRDKHSILQAIIRISDAEPEARDAFVQAWERTRCLALWWGVEKPERVHFESLEHKKHTLLAYKCLAVIWFDEFPEHADEKFRIDVSSVIVKEVTAQLVLRVFRLPNDVLAELCSDYSRSPWFDHENNRSIWVTLESCPQEA